MFKVNETVSHPGHGACKINGICEKEFAGEMRSYYELFPMVEPGATVYVPVDNAEKIGLRGLINEAELDTLLASLPGMDTDWIQDTSTKQKRFKALFEKNSVQDLFETMKAVCAIVRHQKQKALGNADKEMLRALQNKALSEIAAVKGISLQAAIRQTEDIILQNNAQPA